MYKLNPQSDLPIYQQIVEQTKELVIRGVLQNGEQMPSIRELATILAINPTTVAKAYKLMENDGFIEKVQGKGSFITYQGIDKDIRIKELQKEIKCIFEEMRFLKVEKNDIKEQILQILEKIE